MILASSEVRPGQVYRVVVTLLSSFSPLNFIASLQRDGEEVASGKEDHVNAGEDAVIMFQVRSESLFISFHI
ncbi:hypothetical protein B4U80_04220 [Leptotrombidium deliense]|uniref:Uncharacterized protein n=1 Tax=Leptotrombidium deliense TaxID=299467 RepID=A0A443S5R0_9ACAR|nr:hypothetical protein B4U80_04220 [Leptotrombidium deliense]